MFERDYRENNHPPYCTCVDCEKGLNKSTQTPTTKKPSKIYKLQKKKSIRQSPKNKIKKLKNSVFENTSYKWEPSEKEKVTVSKKKTIINEKVKTVWKPGKKKKSNKKPRYNPNKKSKQFQQIKPKKKKSLFRKIIGLGFLSNVS